MLSSLDLFTGIGGFAHGLRGVAKPAAYCEIDTHATSIIELRMSQGMLPPAPICADVTMLSRKWMEETTGHAVVDLITAGFPCQGFSLMGHRKGYAHNGSSLFRHVVRLVEDLKPALVLLENVPDIVQLGMDTVVDSICKQEGYELRWMILGAHHLGAPHVRRRWFCLAIRPDQSATAIAEKALCWLQSHPAPLYAWDSMQPPTAMTLTGGRTRRVRCAALGNAVVPDCVRYAFCSLLAFPSHTTPWVEKRRCKRTWPLHGTCKATVDGDLALHSWKPSFPQQQPMDMQLTFDPHTYQTGKPRNKLQTALLLELPVVARRWTTPRHGNVTAANVLTQRTLRDLPSQVRFERGTPDELRSGQISAEFVEYMMGYPIGWTSS